MFSRMFRHITRVQFAVVTVLSAVIILFSPAVFWGYGIVEGDFDWLVIIGVMLSAIPMAIIMLITGIAFPKWEVAVPQILIVAGLEIISALAFFLYDVIRWHLVEYSEDSTSQLLGALALPYEGAVILCSAAAYAIGAGIGAVQKSCAEASLKGADWAPPLRLLLLE